MPGTVFVTDDDAWADVKVFLTDTEALADAVVYRRGTRRRGPNHKPTLKA